MPMKKINTHFITSVFGDRHVNMLFPLIYSITISSPLSKISVYWEDINKNTITILKKTFPNVKFIETNFNFSKDITKRISSKTLVWESAALQNKDEIICLMDADMLVLRPLTDIIRSTSSDIIITDKKSLFPINSGLIIARNSENVSKFFTTWKDETKKIIEDKELFEKANSKTLPYGGADQMSIHLILNYTYGLRDYSMNNDLARIKITTIPCSILNETESCPISKNTHVIHYKGGWRSILFEKGVFTKNRPKSDSWEMYILYIKYFKKSIQKVNQTLNTNYSYKNFGLSIPFYINPRTLQERKFIYPIFFIISWINSIPKRIINFIRERILI